MLSLLQVLGVASMLGCVGKLMPVSSVVLLQVMVMASSLAESS